MNIVCTSKPGDGLLRYSYEHCSYLNLLGIKSKLIIITHPKFNKEDYLNCIKEQYIHCENILFDDDKLNLNDCALIMGRSMLTLPYLNKKQYTTDQLLTTHLLFSNKLISVYSENNPIDYPKAIEYFKPKKVYDLCDYDVYPNGVGEQFEKIINFSIYKSFKNDVKHPSQSANSTLNLPYSFST